MAVTTVSSLAEMYTSAPAVADNLGKGTMDSPIVEKAGASIVSVDEQVSALLINR